MIDRLPRTVLVGLALTGLLALPACGQLTGSDPEPTSTSSDSIPAPTPTGTAADTGDGNLPDVCALLSESDVQSLTGREISQTDKDGGPSSATRYCQWQLSQGQLAVFLSPTDEAKFATRPESAEDYSGVGDEAFTDSGHLYVRSGDIVIDVYATGAEGEGQDIEVAKTTAEKVITLL